jgi:hypothetical protein
MNGGAKPEHIVRMSWHVTDQREHVAAHQEIGESIRELIGSFAAMRSGTRSRSR